MIHMHVLLSVAGVITLLGAFLAGSYFIAEEYFADELWEKAAQELAEGNYAAALQLYSQVEKSEGNNSPEDSPVRKKVEEAKKLLVAEDVFTKAQIAAENGDWLRVKTLLQQSDATLNPSFKFYEKAIDLYIQSANKVKELEEKIESELAQFREDALREKTLRESAENKTEQVRSELQVTLTEKEKKEDELQASLAQKEAERQEAEKRADEERLQKFLSEFTLYVSMLKKGSNYLEDARQEIEKGKDTTALVLISQGKVLFDEVKIRAEELLENRTEENYKDDVRNVLQASAILIDAVRSLGNAVFYIEDQETEEFSQFLSGARSNQSTALKILGEL